MNRDFRFRYVDFVSGQHPPSTVLHSPMPNTITPQPSNFVSHQSSKHPDQYPPLHLHSNYPFHSPYFYDKDSCNQASSALQRGKPNNQMNQKLTLISNIDNTMINTAYQTKLTTPSRLSIMVAQQQQSARVSPSPSQKSQNKQPPKRLLPSACQLRFIVSLDRKVGQLKKSAFDCIRKCYENKNQMLVMFMNHCATLIQKHWRRYIQRKYYCLFQKAKLRLKELIEAMATGWKVRRVFKTKTIQRMMEQIRRKQSDKKFRDARIQKREFVQEINKLLKGSKWIEDVKPDRRNQKMKVQKFRFLPTASRPIKTLQNVQEDLKNPRESTIKQQASEPKQKPSSQYDQRPLPAQKQSKWNSFDDIPIKSSSNKAYVLQAGEPVDIVQQNVQKKLPKKKVKLNSSNVSKIEKVQQKTKQSAVTLKMVDTPVDNSKKQVFESKSTTLISANIRGDLDDPMQISSVTQILNSLPNQFQPPLKENAEKPQEQQDIRKKFLKRRTKYDPRKAIEQQKRRKLIAPSKVHNEAQIAHPLVHPKSIQKQRQSSMNKKDITVRPASNAGRPKILSPDVSKQFNTTLKRVKIPKIEVPQSVQIINITSCKTPVYRPKDNHIGLHELQTTYSGCYLKNKYRVMGLIQKMGRSLRKMSYPIPSVRQNSSIYLQFSTSNFQTIESILQQDYQSMVNM